MDRPENSKPVLEEDRETLVKILHQMILIRRFEEKCAESYSLGKIGGFCHLYIGQEAVGVGAISALRQDDYVLTSYREHGQAIAKGMSPDAVMAELYGKAGGCSRGKGGSMHLFDVELGFLGGHAIVGGQIPLATGVAFAAKYKETDQVTLCFFGEAAVNQGAFHESLNIAALFDVPVIYVIENNGYSMGTSQKRSSSYKDCLARRAEGYDIAWDVIDGSDLYEVRAKTHIALERARKESKPTVLEISTYRYYGHSVADANAKKYRTPEEIENYKQNHDPITLFRRRLIAEGVLTEESADAINKEAADEAAASCKFAEESPAPKIADIMTDVYWETDNNTEASKLGRHFFND